MNGRLGMDTVAARIVVIIFRLMVEVEVLVDVGTFVVGLVFKRMMTYFSNAVNSIRFNLIGDI